MNATRVVTGWLILIGLYTALTNSSAISAGAGSATSFIQRLSDPNVALIPNRASESTTTPAPTDPNATEVNLTT